MKKKSANYNFPDDSGKGIQIKMDEFIMMAEESGASRSEIGAGISKLTREAETLFDEAREEKFNKGIIPFRDSDDNAWYTKFAAEAKEDGLVKGTGTSGGTEFNPAGNANVAETVAMFARIFGEDTSAQPSSNIGKRMPSWASAATLERKVNLDEIFGRKQAGDFVTRAEVARLIHKLFNLPSGDAGHFSDIGLASPAERDAIGAVNRADIMTGEGGTDRFNVKGSLNRAALIKVLIKAKELAQ